MRIPKSLWLPFLIGVAMASTTSAQNTLPPFGNVGVGTNNPQTILHIKAAGGHACAAQLRLETQIGGATNGCGPASSIWDLSSFGSNTLAFTTPSIVTPVLTLTGLGNVGINIGNPNAKLHVVGKVRIFDGTQGANKVLTSDTTGLASWQALPGAGIGGSGPPNALAKFTGATTIGGSQISDNGTNVAVSSLAFSVSSLAFSGSGTRMVVANPSGQLSTQTIASAGDNLGNHTALTSLNMTSHSINNVGNFVGFDNGAKISEFGVGPLGDLEINTGVGILMAPDTFYVLRIGGSAYAGGFWDSSDRRYKKNVRELARPLDRIMQLRGVQFEFDKAAVPCLRFNDGANIGFVAQEVARVLPEVVRQDSEGYHAINYSAVVPVLVEAIKEQQAMINSTLSHWLSPVSRRRSRWRPFVSYGGLGECDRAQRHR